MKNRLPLRQRLKRAWTNLKSILRDGWSSISLENRKAIVRALFVLAIVILIGGVGLGVLSFRPKRRIETQLACKTIRSSAPLHMILHYGTRDVRLWEFAGTAEECDRDSIHPKPTPQLPDRFVTLEFSRTKTGETPWLEILTAPSEGELDLDLPAHTTISLTGQPSGSTVDIKIVTVNGGETRLQWQIGNQVTISANNLDMRPVDLPREPLRVSPIAHSLITFHLSADRPNATVAINAERNAEALVLRPNDLAKSIDFEVERCAGAVVLDDRLRIEMTAAAPGEFKIEAAKAKEFGMKIVDGTPSLAIDNASGMANQILIGGLNANPRLYEDIWSKGLLGSGIAGIMVIGFTYILGVAAKKAVDVLADIVIPDAQKFENSHQNSSSESRLPGTIDHDNDSEPSNGG